MKWAFGTLLNVYRVSAGTGIISVHKNVLTGLSDFFSLGYLLIHSYLFVNHSWLWEAQQL